MRYSDPSKLVDMMIRSKRFAQFVDESIKIKHEEEKEQLAQEIWVNARPDMSYTDVLAMLDGKQPNEPEAQQISTDELKATIMQSKELLNSFCPN